jgi:hypothetical protein
MSNSGKSPPTKPTHFDLDIFRIDFDHTEKEMIVVGEKDVFGVANFNYSDTDKHWIGYFYPKTVIICKGVPINHDNIALIKAA